MNVQLVALRPGHAKLSIIPRGEPHGLWTAQQLIYSFFKSR